MSSPGPAETRATRCPLRRCRATGLVVVLGTILCGLGVGNMLPASEMFAFVDINPAVASKLCDRGSSNRLPIVMDAGLFLASLDQQLPSRASG